MDRRSFLQGVKASAPALPTMFVIFLGYGVTAQLEGVPAIAAFLMTVFIYAAPAQYAIIDLAAGGAAAIQLIVVGVLANLRFFLMSLTLSQMFEGVSRRQALPWAHFVAATPFLLTFFRARKEQPVVLFDYYRGISAPIAAMILLGTAAGIALGGDMPPPLAFAATLFMPIYFSLLITTDIKSKFEMAAVGFGFTLTPIAETLMPGWGMALVALGAGLALTLAEK